MQGIFQFDRQLVQKCEQWIAKRGQSIEEIHFYLQYTS
jgi:hypothetical protein